MVRRLLPALALALAVACSSSEVAVAPCAQQGVVRFAGGDRLQVRIAGDEASRQRGLMGVTALPDDEGMAFVWDDTPVTGTFWMKDTLIPLSIAFVDGEERIVTIREMTPCRTDTCETYAASAPYAMAIEANAGWFDARGLTVGDRASLETECPA